jgi:hypothetical protein
MRLPIPPAPPPQGRGVTFAKPLRGFPSNDLSPLWGGPSEAT